MGWRFKLCWVNSTYWCYTFSQESLIFPCSGPYSLGHWKRRCYYCLVLRRMLASCPNYTMLVAQWKKIKREERNKKFVAVSICSKGTHAFHLFVLSPFSSFCWSKFKSPYWFSFQVIDSIFVFVLYWRLWWITCNRRKAGEYKYCRWKEELSDTWSSRQVIVFSNALTIKYLSILLN